MATIMANMEIHNAMVGADIFGDATVGNTVDGFVGITKPCATGITVTIATALIALVFKCKYKSDVVMMAFQTQTIAVTTNADNGQLLLMFGEGSGIVSAYYFTFLSEISFATSLKLNSNHESIL